MKKYTEILNSEEVPSGILVAFWASLFVVVPILIGAAFEMLTKVITQNDPKKKKRSRHDKE